jgi:Uma2 family endonuclease
MLASRYELLREQAKPHGAKVRIALRVRTCETRVPDIAVWRAFDEIGRGFAATPPFLAVEILSPDDRMSRVAQKVHEYFNGASNGCGLSTRKNALRWFTPR